MTSDDTIYVWEQHATYVLDVLLPLKRKPRRSCMTYLGTDSDGLLQFNARPAAGTQTLEQSWIVRAEKLSRTQGRDDTRHYVNRAIR